MDVPKRALELTGLEIVFLTDAVNNDDVNCSLPDAHKHLARELLLVLGSAYMESIFIDGVRDISLTLMLDEEQAWLLRSKVKTWDVDAQNRPIGIPLLRKLYPFILGFHSGLDSNWVEDMADREARAQRLAEWRERQHGEV